MKSQGFTLLEVSIVLLILIALAGVVLPYLASTAEESACQASDATLAAIKEAIVGGPSGPSYYSDLQKRLPYYRDASGNADCADDTDTTGGAPRYHLHFLSAVSTFGSLAKSLCPKSLQSFHPNLGLGWRGPYAKGASKLFNPDDLDSRFDDFDYVHVKHKTDHKEDLYFLDQFRWRAPVVLQVPDATENCPTHLGTNDGFYCARLVSAGPDGRLDTQINDVDASNRNDDRVVFLFVPDPSSNRPCIEK